VATFAKPLGFVEGDVDVAHNLRDVFTVRIHTTTPRLARCSRLRPEMKKGFVELSQETSRDQFGLFGSADPFGEIQELVATKSTQRVGRARDECQAARHFGEELIAG